jgi:hypothetical protein
MERLAAQHPSLEFHLVVGLDLVPTLPKWIRAETLMKDVRFVVAGRPGTTPPGSPSCWPTHFRILQYQGGPGRTGWSSDWACAAADKCPPCACRRQDAPSQATSSLSSRSSRAECSAGCGGCGGCGGCAVGCTCACRDNNVRVSGGQRHSSRSGGSGGSAAPPDPRFCFTTSATGVKVAALLCCRGEVHAREAPPTDLTVLATLVSSSEVRDRLGSVDPAGASRAITGLVAVSVAPLFPESTSAMTMRV